MTDDPTPTTSRRQLGLRLRALRRRAGKTAQQVADDLQFSLSKVSRLETGDRAMQEADVAVLLHYFGVDDDETEELRTLARDSRRRRVAASQPEAKDAGDITMSRSGFLDLERDATRIREFNGGVVPGLLQTAEYMRRAILEASPGIEPGLIEAAVKLRLQRQKVLQDRRPYEVIVDESVLLRVVGGWEVMQRQIETIRRAMTRREVSFRVVPLTAGAHPAVNTMFVLLRTQDASSPDIVFTEGIEGQVKIDRDEDVQRFDRTWRYLLSLAERSGQTDERLNDLVARYADTKR